MRRLAWAAIAAQFLFVASWLVAGAMEDGYSHARSGVGVLAREGAANPAIVIGGLVVLGLSFIALAAALAGTLPRRAASSVAVTLFACVGVAYALTGVVRLQCDLQVAGCEAGAHGWIGLVASVLLALTPYAISRALWASPAAAAALAAGNVGLWLGAGIWAAMLSVEGAGGVFERFGWLLLHVWVIAVAAGVLHATRRASRPGPLIPLRPRDFLAREWEGEGELVLRPLFLGRFFAQRMHARRRAVWVSERVWRFDDEATFSGGHVHRRQNWCEFVTDDHVRVTAGDLPEGADVWIEDDGFRVCPFRFAFPIGPVPVPGECRDRSYVERDGTLVNEMDAYVPGLQIPYARLTFRVRPVEPAAERSQEVAALA
jgi:hypothetical protein